MIRCIFSNVIPLSKRIRTYWLRNVDTALLISLVLSCKPYAVQINQYIDNLWDFLVIAQLVFVLINALIKREDFFREKSWRWLLLGAFLLEYIARTFFSNISAFPGAVSESARILLLVVGICRSGIQDRRRCISTIYLVYSTCLSLDCFTVFLSQITPLFGSPNYSLFGLDNYAIFAIFPMLASVCYASFYLDGLLTKRAAVIYILCLFGKIASGAVTSVLILGLFGIILCLTLRKKVCLTKLFTLQSGALVLLVVTVVVVVFRCDQMILPLLEVIGKSSTVESRALIWEKSIASITQSPVFGFGKMSNGLFQEITGFSPIWDIEADHTHNGFLELVFSTGVVGVTLFSMYFIKSFDGCKGRLDKAGQVLEGAAFALMLLMISDAYPFMAPIYTLPAMASFFDLRKSKKEIHNNNSLEVS